MQNALPRSPVLARPQSSFPRSWPRRNGRTTRRFCPYGLHDSKRYRLLGETGWAERDPAYSYTGQAMRIGRKRGPVEEYDQPRLEAKNQFALELDHMAGCVQQKRRPHTPGEEGMQDMRVIAAVYKAARTGAVVKLPAVDGLTLSAGRRLRSGPKVPTSSGGLDDS